MHTGSTIALLLLYAIASSCQENLPQNNTGHRLWPRQISIDITMCPLEYEKTPLGNLLTHFYGYMTTSWTDSGGALDGIPEPVEVGDDFRVSTGVHALIGSQQEVYCLTGTINGGGLVVGNQVTSIDGSVEVSLVDESTFSGNNATMAKFFEAGSSCRLMEGSTGTVKLDFTNEGMATTSQYLSQLKPDIRMSSIGEITWLDVDTPHPAYHVITLDTCDSVTVGSTCMSLTSEQLSDPNGILFSGESWTGPATPIDADGRTIVINVPVTNGSQMRVTTTRPSNGLLHCRTVFNFFPVARSGNFITTGSYPIYFTGNGYIEGVFLFYKGYLKYDKSYTMTFGDKCQSSLYQGCFPVLDYSTTLPSSRSTEKNSATDALYEPVITTTTTTTTTTDFITTNASEATETDVSTVTVIHYTTVNTATVTARNSKPATKTATTSYTVTTIDIFGVTSTTTTYTAMRTILIPVPNQWPPVDEKNRNEDEKKDKIKHGKRKEKMKHGKKKNDDKKDQKHSK